MNLELVKQHACHLSCLAELCILSTEPFTAGNSDTRIGSFEALAINMRFMRTPDHQIRCGQEDATATAPTVASPYRAILANASNGLSLFVPVPSNPPSVREGSILHEPKMA